MEKSINIRETVLLSDEHYPLKKITYEVDKKDGSKTDITREIYVPDDAVAILLYHPVHQTVLLTKQFRLAAYINGHVSGALLEVCAGLIEKKESPEDCARREVEEETGYRINAVKKVFELFSTPGAVTEKIHCCTATYHDAQKLSAGGGLASEQEDIEVLEIPFEEAYAKIAAGKIQDAKTVLLLQYARLHLFEKNTIVSSH